MCDRTKSEILARELCIEFWAGQDNIDRVRGNRTENLNSFVESNWHKWLEHSNRVILMLDKHKE